MIDAAGALARESRRFHAAFSGCPSDAGVPSCPGWKADDLLWHLAAVQWNWARLVLTGATTREQQRAVGQETPARPAERPALLAFAEEATLELLDALEKRPDDTPAWTWFPPDQSVGFIRRRQVHEALIHRVDAELTAGVPVSTLQPELAEDGIDEVFEVMWAAPSWCRFEAVGRPVQVRATDVERTWLLQPGRGHGLEPGSGDAVDEPTAIQAGDGTPAAALLGTAAELDRWLWGRGDTVQREGDAEALARIEDVVARGMR